MGDIYRVGISTENEISKIKLGSYYEKWSEESKAKFLKQIDDKKRANFIRSGMKKQTNKHY